MAKYNQENWKNLHLAIKYLLFVKMHLDFSFNLQSWKKSTASSNFITKFWQIKARGTNRLKIVFTLDYECNYSSIIF